jgi:branched-subunit amino acid transport protein
MSDLALFTTILVMGFVTFGIRFSLIALADRMTLSTTVRSGLKYVPIAVLSAIIFPDIFVQQGQIAFAWSNPFLISALAAGTTAWFTKNVIATLAVGLIVVWMLA